MLLQMWSSECKEELQVSTLYLMSTGILFINIFVIFIIVYLAITAVPPVAVIVRIQCARSTAQGTRLQWLTWRQLQTRDTSSLT